LALLPEWKRVEFKETYFDVDRESLEPALVFRKENEREYAYLRQAYEAEREIEGCIRKLTAFSNITFKSPVTDKHWKDLLFDPNSNLAEKSRSEYEQAIEAQALVCGKVFPRPVSVVLRGRWDWKNNDHPVYSSGNRQGAWWPSHIPAACAYW
jgi:hypothetical protein